MPDTVDSLWAGTAAPSAAWRAAVQQAPPETREALLARADAAWSPDPIAKRHASVVYRALEAHLVPSDPVDCLRIRRLLDEGSVMSLERLMIVTEHQAADPEVRHYASLVLGQWDLVRGDAARCERRYLDALEAGNARWPGLVSAAYANYARLCLEQRRDLEGLVLARRGAEASAVLGDHLGTAYGRLVEAYVLSQLEDWTRLRALCDRLPWIIDALPSHQRLRIEYGLHGVQAELAIGEGRPQDAFREQATADRLAKELGDPSWSPRDCERIAAQAHAAMGHDREALEAAERGLAHGPAGDVVGLVLQTLRVRSGARLGAPSLRDDVRAWLAALEGDGSRLLGSGLRLVQGHLGADALLGVGGFADEARHAYRLAASAMLQRLRELHHFARDLRDVARPTPLEMSMLDDHRRRTEVREAALRAAVSRLLAEEVRAGRWPLTSLAPAGGMVCSCAWCGRLRAPDGTWHPLPATLSRFPSDVVPVTHGVCHDCVPSLLSPG